MSHRQPKFRRRPTSEPAADVSSTDTTTEITAKPAAEAFDLEFPILQISERDDGTLLLTGFSSVFTYDPSFPVEDGVNPRQAAIPTRDDLADSGCIDHLVEDATPNVSLNDSCYPEFLDSDPEEKCFWALLPNTLDCYSIGDPETTEPLKNPLRRKSGSRRVRRLKRASSTDATRRAPANLRKPVIRRRPNTSTAARSTANPFPSSARVAESWGTSRRRTTAATNTSSASSAMTTTSSTPA